MATLRVTSFKAEAPRVERANLPPEYGSQSINIDTSRGLVEAFRKPSVSYTSLESSIKTIYHYQFGDSTYWLTWPVVVDVARSPVPQDSLGRIYFTGDGEPRMFTYADGISGPGPYPFQSFVLGVTAPKTAATITPPSGGTTVTRSYVYTFKTALSEESGPSPAVVASGNDAGTWALSGLDLPPPNSGTVSTVVVAAGVATIDMSSTFGLFAGEELVFAGMPVAELDGKHKLASVGSTQVTIALAGVTASGSGGTWDRVAGHNLTGMVRCIYRTTGTDTTYRRSAAMVITSPSATTYNDTEASTNLSITLDNLEANTPPKDLHSLVALPNGCHVGWSKNELCFSEANKPHSYPVSLRYTQPANGVALAVAGMGVIALTDEVVRYAIAPTPASVSFDNIGSNKCIAKTGVAIVDGGCVFPSMDGWYAATPSGVTKLSDGVFRQQEWDQITPTSLVAAYQDGYYIAMHQDTAGAIKMLRFNIFSKDAIENVDIEAHALHISKVDSRLYFALGPNIYVWASDQAAFMTGSWVSKLWTLPSPTNMAVARINAAFNDPFYSQSADDLAYNESILGAPWLAGGSLGGGPIGSIVVGGSRMRRVDASSVAQVVFTILNEAGDILYTKAVTSDEPFRLPGGFKERAYSYGISSNIPVRSFGVSTSLRELLRAG